MKEKYVFADVDLPFHVWVREGSRWVLRDAAIQLQQPNATPRDQPSPASGSAASAPRH